MGETEASGEEVMRQHASAPTLCLPFFLSKVGNSLTLDILRTIVSQVMGASSRNEKKERGKKKRESEPEAGKRANQKPQKGKGWNWYHVRYFHPRYSSFSAIWKKGIIVPSFWMLMWLYQGVIASKWQTGLKLSSPNFPHGPSSATCLCC